jgi:MFS family permease
VCTAGRGEARRAAPHRLRQRLADSARAVRQVVASPALRRAELSFAAAWTAECAFTVGLGVFAFRQGGAAAVGLVTLLRMLPSALASPVLSALADRTRRERALAAVSIVRGAAIGASAALLAAGAPDAAVYALAVVATVVFTVFRPAHSALLPSLSTTTAQLTSANVVRGILDAGGTLLGPALAGVLLAVADTAALFAAVAVLCGASALAVVGLRYDRPLDARTSARPALLREAVDGARAVAATPDLRLLFGLGFAQTVVRGALAVYVVVVAIDLLDTGDAGVAALSAAVGIGGLAGSFAVSLLVGSRHLGAWLGVALALWGAPIAVLGASPTAAAGYVLLATVGLANAVVDIPFFTLPVRLAPDAVLARAFGVFEALVALGVGVGSVVAPVLLDLLGVRGALVATGAALPVLALVCGRRLAALDRRLGVREAEIDVLRDVPVLRPLPVPSIEQLARRVRRATAPAGAVLVRQGDPGDGFFVLTAGRAEVVGDGAVVRTLGPGDAFGEIALLHDVPRTATVRACSEVTVFELERDDFLDAVAGFNPSADTARDVVAGHLANYRPAGAAL